jgi:hypothetical protein
MKFNWPRLSSIKNMNKFLLLVSAFGIPILLSYVIGLAMTIDLLQVPENLMGKILFSVTLFH